MLRGILEAISVLLSGLLKLYVRRFLSEGDGGGVTENIDVEVEIIRCEGGASLSEDVLEGVDFEVGIILEVFLSGGVVPAGISASVDVSNGLGQSVDGEGLSTIEEEVVEGDLREEIAEDILELNLTSVELVADLSEEVEFFSIDEAVRVSVVDGEPQGDNLERNDVHVDVGDVETEEVEGEANVGI